MNEGHLYLWVAALLLAFSAWLIHCPDPSLNPANSTPAHVQEMHGG